MQNTIAKMEISQLNINLQYKTYFYFLSEIYLQN